jgi:D-inositol-3-phosphate glycosyltransferase
MILIGKGKQAGELRERIRRADLDQVVQIHSWVSQDELVYWYSAADALLLPSHSEAFSRTILEAMICGTPVIGSRITGTEDHVRDGINGFLFPAADIQALAAILSEVIEDPDILRHMRPTTLTYAQTHLTLPVIVKRIVDEVYMPTYLDRHLNDYQLTI